MKNKEIAKNFNDIADILEIKNDNPFRIRAYRKAALTIEGLNEDIEKVVSDKRLNALPGIGKDLAGKIEEYVYAGKMKFYETLKKSIPAAMVELMAIPGVGPKTAKVLCDRMKIKNIDDLKRKAKSGKIKNIFGIKDKTVENILKGIEFIEKASKRTTLDIATRISEGIISELRKIPGVKKVTAAGSLRRMKETVRDIDILMTCDRCQKAIDAFTGLPGVKQVLAHGPTKASAITKERIRVDVRAVKPSDFGAALLYFTGSKSHNIILRKMAKKKGFKINEYGIFRLKGNKKIAGAEEKDIYKTLGLDYIPPELREDRGEINAALQGSLPKLVDIKDIKGDLHVHTEKSDGTLTLEQIAAKCRNLGYEYCVVTDHSKTLHVAGGLNEKELMKSVEMIGKINKKLKGIRLFAGSEVDIHTDGSLDYNDSVLKELDFVIAAIHSGFKQPKKVITERLVKAMENKYVNMIAHPTGRLIGVREGYEIDLDSVLEAAGRTGTAIEINSYPERLDLDDVSTKRAREMGVAVGISTDTHTPGHFENMKFGVSVARRAWLEKKDILNTLDLEGFRKRISAKRR